MVFFQRAKFLKFLANSKYPADNVFIMTGVLPSAYFIWQIHPFIYQFDRFIQIFAEKNLLCNEKIILFEVA